MLDCEKAVSTKVFARLFFVCCVYAHNLHQHTMYTWACNTRP